VTTPDKASADTGSSRTTTPPGTIASARRPAAGSRPLPFRLPPEDRRLSPYTGWTRAHWEATADGLLCAARQFASPGGALLDLPGRPSVSGVRSDGLEGFARTFLAAAFRVAGAGGADPHGWLSRYAEGLATGTRTPGRADAESWPPILDHGVAGQPMVESASVALGLRLTRPWLWDHLDTGVRERVEEWLRGALRHVPAPNNWYLFPLTVAGFLQSAGRGDQETRRAIDRGLELLEGWYAGEGWYSDGDGRAFDHYNGWALHLYPLLNAHLAGDREQLAHYGGRLRQHLDGFGLLFGGDGAPIHFGRSLTYRFAAGAAVALGALTGYTPLAPGVSRRVLSGAVRHFLDRGALTDDGLLSLGWHGPHAATVQGYSGPASPYWASKGLLPLLVPADDPLWTAREERAPSEGEDRAAAIAPAGLLIQTTGGDGLVRLHNHGSSRLRPHEGEDARASDPLYARLAYSTRTGPTAPGNPPDNHFALHLPDENGDFTQGASTSARVRVHPLGAASGNASGPGPAWAWAASWHTPVFPSGPPAVPGLRVESVTFVRGRFELRVHRVTGAPPGALVRLTGWATGPRDAVRGELRGLYGWHTAEPAWLRAPAGTACTRWALLPELSGEAGSGKPGTSGGTALFAALAALTGEEARESAGLGEAAEVISAGPASLRVRWRADGALTRIGFAPLSVAVEGEGTESR
jgi:hypothetical protein